MLYYHFEIVDRHNFNQEKIIQEANTIIKEELELQELDCDYDFFITRTSSKENVKTYHLTAVFI